MCYCCVHGNNNDKKGDFVSRTRVRQRRFHLKIINLLKTQYRQNNGRVNQSKH
jgi:hypothetical protein